MSLPTCTIIAGPNGAGKTTFALNYLLDIRRCQHFINADLIASGLSPLLPKLKQAAASRLFLSEIKKAVIRREDFSFETTLSGKKRRLFLYKINKGESLKTRRFIKNCLEV